MNKHLSLSADYQRNDISLPVGTFTVTETGGRIELGVTPDLFSSLFVQWNNDDNIFLINFRLNYIFTPGSNFYLVVNQSYDTQRVQWQTTYTTVLAKLIWRFVL